MRRVGPDARVLVAIPALNEATSLPGVLSEIRATNPMVDILVVDDGSTDDTAAVAEACGAVVCRLPYNLGVGGAMRTAYRWAERSGHDVVVQVDADGQHDPAGISSLVEGLSHADVVIGARFAGVGDYRARWVRRAGMRLLARIVSRRTVEPLSDVTSGFRAAGPRAIRVFAQHYPTEYLADTVESLMIGLKAGLHVAQIPVAMRYRVHGRPSQNEVRSCMYFLRTLAALALVGLRQWPVSESDVADGAIPAGLSS